MFIRHNIIYLFITLKCRTSFFLNLSEKKNKFAIIYTHENNCFVKLQSHCILNIYQYYNIITIYTNTISYSDTIIIFIILCSVLTLVH